MNWYKNIQLNTLDYLISSQSDDIIESLRKEGISIGSGFKDMFVGLAQTLWGILKTTVYFVADLPLSNIALADTGIDVEKAFLDIIKGIGKQLKGAFEISAGTFKLVFEIAMKTGKAIKNLILGYIPDNIDEQTRSQIEGQANRAEEETKRAIINHAYKMENHNELV